MTELETLLAGSEPALSGVHPILRQRCIRMITVAAGQGLYFAAFQGYRSFEQQAADYAKGRTAPGPQVTKAQPGDSLHQYGIAADLVEDGDVNNVGIQWSWKNNADYLRLGNIAKDCLLEWGGFWKAFKDYPHVQLTGGLTLAQIKAIYAAGQTDAVWKAVSERVLGISGATPEAT